jgi:hypothetical protein
VKQHEDIVTNDDPSTINDRLRNIARKPLGDGKTDTIRMIDLVDPITQSKAPHGGPVRASLPDRSCQFVQILAGEDVYP